MAKPDDKQKKQDLGIFYTPPAVTDFIFDILNIWKEKEEKETGRWESRGHSPSVIDPAVGEGVFLKSAIAKGFTEPKYVFGVDIDESVKEKWVEINLLKSFGSRAELNVHFFHQNGLLPLDEKKVLRYKKGGLKEFDAVVGNPPYGGLGIYDDMKSLSETISSSEKVSTVSTQTLNTLFGGEVEKRIKINRTVHKKVVLPPLRLFELRELSKALLDYEIWKDKNYVANRIEFPLSINNVPFNLKYVLTTKEIERLKSFPIEILFLERFLRLAKPGGWVAIIVPDGILTNSNAHYVREFIADKAKVETIVSLPRGTFKHAGTTAKTSILFLRKRKEGESPGQDYSVFLASAENINEESFQKVAEEYKKFYNITNKSMNKSNQIIIKDTSGKEAVMVRVDKTLKEMMEEKPSSRWDAAYWRPIYDEILSKVSGGFKVVPLENVLNEPIIAPDHVRASKGEKIGNGKEFSCEYRTLKDLMFTGLNYAGINYCSENAYKRLGRTKLSPKDILFAGSGVGAIGRLGIVERVSAKSCVGDLFVIRNPKLNPYYLCVYLLTEFGQSQIEKIFHGISSAKISVGEIGQIKTVLIDEPRQKHIESEYKKMSTFHDKAMEVKKKGDEAGYRKNIETAEAMLRDLIARTEAVIRGEQDDVI